MDMERWRGAGGELPGMENPEMPCLGKEALPREMSGRASDAGKESGSLKDPMRGAGGGAAGDTGDDSPCQSASELGAGNSSS